MGNDTAPGGVLRGGQTALATAADIERGLAALLARISGRDAGYVDY